ncbi:ABC transporter substrate-binding protein [Marinobacter zhanjiangensis]|uniref:Iron ABC transporter substrate-binding protein n=1 Tax=Marinobacter zhanjiangensis TaxID=578215 RepID=A0ABQ3B2X9_9GAMM|nr:ABC transporter substrate-binding protein [Marinobacter zhanjiangensis]GGY73021.1 iron ABC transporter substrate-binding protein [Marinobacter zhanjiangensis]
MNMIRNCLMAMVGAAVLSGCGTLSKDIAGPMVISFDHGATDTLVELGLEEKIVAVPKTGLPDYLGHLAAARPDAGNLKTPDLDVVADAEPDLVLVTGRQAESLEALQEIVQVQDVSLLGDDYREGVQVRVLGLATLYGMYEEAESRLQALWKSVDQARDGITGNPQVVVVTHNDDNFSLRDEPVVSQLLGLEQPDVPAGVESVTRGTRVFTPATPEVLADMAPDHLFVVDRSAAIGDEPLDASTLRRDLQAVGAGDIEVTILSPGLWYLSGGGLQSVRLQVQEILGAL